MLNRFVILSLFILSCHAGIAQPRIEIGGKVTDSRGTGLILATILLITKKEKAPPALDTLSTISGTGGLFHFTRAIKDSFEVQVTMKGYLSYRQLLSVNGDSSLKAGRGILQLPPIQLQENFQVLEAVTVVQARPITIHGD